MTPSRRNVLKAAGVGAGAVLAPGIAGRAFATARPSGPVHAPAKLEDIEHVVILMQENRSFDQYFGSLRGVRGFDDPSAMRLETGNSVFFQPDVDALQNPSHLPYLLPWHLDTKKFDGQQNHGLSHAWSAQQNSWNLGLMDGFVLAHRIIDDDVDDLSSGKLPLTDHGAATMGYYTRDDIPFHYALADAFTICDNYHASVFGPTNPNRIMSMSATVDPEGIMGGPCLDNSQHNLQLQWEAYPEALQRAGIDWYLYQEADNFQDNMLPFFKGFANTKSDLYRRGNSFIPTPKGEPAGPALAAKLKADVLSGNLPQVSWIVGAAYNSEHPDGAAAYGAHFIHQVLDALTADPKVWAKTALFLNYDENDGLFDHVPPPMPPPGTPGEFVQGVPIGGGFRVPCLIVSPWTAGGWVCSQTLDHTSVIQFLEKVTGVTEPSITAWRREAFGDMTAAFRFNHPLEKPPVLPNAHDLLARANYDIAHLPQPVLPAANQAVPAQEKDHGLRRPAA